MKPSQLVLSLFIVIAMAAGSIAQATDTTITQLDKCKAKPKHAICYEAEVPETDSDHKKITIDVNYWPATGDRLNPYPVVWLMGGPGTTNLEPPMPDWMWEHFDVLAVGYRGTDGTPRLDCPALRKQFGKEGKNNKEDFLSQASLDRLTDKVSDCQQHWESEGVNTQAYGVYEVVEDIDRVRKALGFEKINLLSVSYGTRIAWYFDQLKPELVDRNLFMSANPDGGFFFDPVYLDLQLTELERLCNENSECFEKLPNLTSTIDNVLTNLPEKAWGVHLDSDQIRLVTFMMLYSRNSMPMVIDAYSKALDGNYSGLVAMQKFPNPFKGKGMVWGTFFSAGAVDLHNLSSFQQQLTESEKTTVLNSPLSELLYNGMTRGWKMREYQPLENRITQTPTLILASDIDVATPVERVEQFWMPYVANGALVNVQGAGHAPDHMFAGGPDMDALLINFLTTGETTINQAYGKPFEFEAGFSLSWMTYGFWGIVASITAGLLVAAIIIL
jgi:pimeloyl-ACP methyl ester carboxylesterase